ncbi:MAG TPA: hypothetical protein VFQ53_13685 [Kofleriaceae bacterium]|nr:hypothetical protein [Kofleriaceae bacterium]
MADPGTPDAAYDALATEAIDACARAYPDVRIDRTAVLAQLRGFALADVETWRAHLAELCLVAACVRGDPAAQRAVNGLIRVEAARAAAELRQPAWLADEIQQELAQRLLIASDGKPPRLATYAGQSALGRWLGVAATRTGLNLTRRVRREQPLEDEDIAAAITAPELALVRERYRDAVLDALRAAFAALDNPRDRNLLRLYYVERIGLPRLGQMFGVHGSTVSRWLTALRETIIEDTSTRLAERLGLAGQLGDLESVLRAVRSDLDLTLSRILRVSE